MSIRKLSALLFLCLSFTCSADDDFVSFTQGFKLPRTMIAGANYPISYTFTNNLPFTLTQGIDVRVTGSRSNYNGNIAITENTCTSAIPSGGTCNWSGTFSPTLGLQQNILVEFSYAGSTYQLPINTGIVNPAGYLKLLGSNLNNEVFFLVTDGSYIFAATETGVKRTMVAGTDSRTWQTIGTNLNGRILSLAIDANGFLYAGPLSQGLYKISMNDIDQSWALFGTGGDSYIFTNLLISAGTLYATTFQDAVRRNLLSAPGPWEQVGTTSVGSSSYALTIVENIIYASSLGVFSNNLNALGAWQNTDNTFGSTVTGLLSIDGMLLSTSTGGVKSYNTVTGRWQDFGDPFPTAAYCIIRLNRDTILVGGDGGVYANSLINPGPWQKVTDSIIPSGPVRTIIRIGNTILFGAANGVYQLG